MITINGALRADEINMGNFLPGQHVQNCLMATIRAMNMIGDALRYSLQRFGAVLHPVGVDEINVWSFVLVHKVQNPALPGIESV